VPASVAALILLHSLAASGRSLAPVLNVALGCALLPTASALLLRGRFMPRVHAADVASSHRQPASARTVGVGAALGVLVTLTSVGAGALGTLALLALFPAMRTVRIVGTDIAHAVPLTLVAGLGHATLGSVDWTLLASLLMDPSQASGWAAMQRAAFPSISCGRRSPPCSSSSARGSCCDGAITMNEPCTVRLQALTASVASTLERIARERAPAAFASSFGAEDMVLLDLVAVHAPSIAVSPSTSAGCRPPRTR
jgi:hypothetical protein